MSTNNSSRSDSARSRSPSKQNAPLPDIPEQTQSGHQHAVLSAVGIEERAPGPNAWMIQNQEVDRHMLQANAFYQQAWAQRRGTPPGQTHPAFRQTNLRDISNPIPGMEQYARESSATSMSPFIASGQATHSPQLKLVPSMQQVAEPTRRAMIEEKNEQIAHSGSSRIPVYRHLPEIKPAEHAQRRSGGRKSEGTSASSQAAPRTPKKSFFDRLRLTGKRETPASAASDSAENKSHMPSKAKAVLGLSSSLARSPSKTKGLLSRKKTAATETRNSRDGNRARLEISPPLSVSGVWGTIVQPEGNINEMSAQQSKTPVARSQNLDCYDSKKPPTPPAKNTPPDEKATKQLTGQETTVLSHPPKTTSHEHAFFNENYPDSPTRMGFFHNRQAPVLVTKPSRYSLHASVVPDAIETSAFNDIKSRMAGLGLEGFNMPGEYQQRGAPECSPSIYSPDWKNKSTEALVRRMNTADVQPENQPDMLQVPRLRDASSTQTMHSSSTSATVPVVYPELASDPSILNFMNPTDVFGLATDSNPPTHEEDEDEKTPKVVHSRFHEHSDSSDDSSADVYRTPHIGQHESPASDHPSAVPSPLQVLPAVAYTPKMSTTKRSRTSNGKKKGSANSAKTIADQTLSAVSPPIDPTVSPPLLRSIFENTPSLPPPDSSYISPKAEAGSKARGKRPQRDQESGLEQTTPPPNFGSATTFDPSVADNILNLVQAQREMINEMRAELRVAGSGVDRRLAALEMDRGARRNPSQPDNAVGGKSPPTGTHASSQSRRDSNETTTAATTTTTTADPSTIAQVSSPGKRITTDMAQEFYRRTESIQRTLAMHFNAAEELQPFENEVVYELRATNLAEKRLIEALLCNLERVKHIRQVAAQWLANQTPPGPQK